MTEPNFDCWAAKLWLWKNGDHYLAFDSEYPTYDGGDPKTLGEPVGYALLDWDAYERLRQTAAAPPAELLARARALGLTVAADWMANSADRNDYRSLAAFVEKHAIAALQSEREAAPAMLHLRSVLYMLADLHPDYQCDAFQQALRFYNEASEVKIEPSGIDRDHLISDANLRARCEAATAEARRVAIEECARQVGCGRWMCSEGCEGPKRIRALASHAPQEETK